MVGGWTLAMSVFGSSAAGRGLRRIRWGVRRRPPARPRRLRQRGGRAVADGLVAGGCSRRPLAPWPLRGSSPGARSAGRRRAAEPEPRQPVAVPGHAVLFLLAGPGRVRRLAVLGAIARAWRRRGRGARRRRRRRRRPPRPTSTRGDPRDARRASPRCHRRGRARRRAGHAGPAAGGACTRAAPCRRRARRGRRRRARRRRQPRPGSAPPGTRSRAATRRRGRDAPHQRPRQQPLRLLPRGPLGFGAHPLGGVGADNFRPEYLVQRPQQRDAAYPHSLELRTLVATGIVGAAAARAFVAGRPRSRRGSARGWPAAVGSAAAARRLRLLGGARHRRTGSGRAPGSAAPAFALGLACGSGPACARRRRAAARGRAEPTALGPPARPAPLVALVPLAGRARDPRRRRGSSPRPRGRRSRAWTAPRPGPAWDRARSWPGARRRCGSVTGPRATLRSGRAGARQQRRLRVASNAA